MLKNVIEELRWRGMLHNITPETEELLEHQKISAYIGFDPTSDSLHVGSLVPIIILKHFQNYSHKPIAVVGGATGMIGDPSQKSKERNLLDEDVLKHNIKGIKAQLEKFIDFENDRAELLNNYDWMKSFTLIEFVRDIGKHITVNYMMSKESVKKRLSSDSTEGMSFTEFTYQLFQGYDFYHLFKEKNCVLQMGGSDQWGNITTGVEFIRRICGGKAHAITCPLITKADGTKFGKTESGNIWLDPKKTSPYKFYQYWINTSDEDAINYVKIFTFISKPEVEELIEKHNRAPQLRILQKTIAETLTLMVHSETDLKHAQKASEVLFGNSSTEELRTFDNATLLDIFAGLPHATLSKADVFAGLPIIDALCGKTGFFASNGEARRALKENAISVNKTKVNDTYLINANDLINDKYVLLQRGKKNYYILELI